jgi:hypothetical protein
MMKSTSVQKTNLKFVLFFAKKMAIFLFGWVIRCKRINKFLCSMLVVHQFLCVLFTLRGIFMHFLELTY